MYGPLWVVKVVLLLMSFDVAGLQTEQQHYLCFLE